MPQLGGRIEVSQSCDARMQMQPVLQQGGEDAEVCSETLQVTTVSISKAILESSHGDRPEGSLLLAMHDAVDRRRPAVTLSQRFQ